MFKGVKSRVSVINLDCRILGEERFYAREATATFLNISSQGLLPKGLRCFVYFGNLFYVWVFFCFVLFIYIYIYIYIKPKPLLAPQFFTSAQYLKNKK